MDIQSLGLDERLVVTAFGSSSRAKLHGKMLEHAVGRGDNVLAKIEVSSGREEFSLLPALQWLLSSAQGERRRVLVAAADRPAAESIAAAARRLGSALSGLGGAEAGAPAALGLTPCLVTPAEESEGGAGAAAVLEGDPGSPLLIGLPSSLLSAAESGLFSLKDFGFLVVEGGERLAELPAELLKAFSAALLPPWERRCIVSCSKISVKAKNLAWELADNPVEIHIEEEAAKAQGIAQESWQLAGDQKLRFLLGLLARSAPPRLAVFCNLKSSAEELALRLSHNGVPTEYILGALPLDRKAATLERLKAGESRVLVLTDQGAEGVAAASFPLVVNYEIPLEPELYVKRLELLDGQAAESKLVNLVCDRYAVGLPAIESYIDAALDARPANETLLEAEDLSAAFVYERPRPDHGGGNRGGARRGGSRGGGGRAGRLVPPPRPAAAERSGAPRREPERGGGRPDSRRAREGGRPSGDRDREDRRPEIWRSIAEATGGDFGRESAAAGNLPRPLTGREPEAEGEPGRSGRNREPKRQQGRGSPQNKGSKASREPERSGKKAQAERKAGLPARGHGKPAGAEPRGDGRENEARGGGNPYELSMEERMRRYREKYGTRLDAEQKGGRAKGQGRSKARPAGEDAKAPPSGEGKRGQSGRVGKGRAEAQGQGQSRGPKPSDGASRAARGAAPDSAKGGAPRSGRGGRGANPVPGLPQASPRQPRRDAAPETPAPKPGVLGKLLGMFKKKSE